MKKNRVINYICILLGGIVAIYAQEDKQQNTYVLIGGLILLCFGIYRTSRNIPSKFDKEETFVKTEKEDDI